MNRAPAPLCGENLVRIGFLDESGRSRGEPIIVVAGPVVHGDRTYRKLVACLRDLASEFLPEADRKGFVFHAKDIFHGSGSYFKPRRGDWPWERRLPILKALADIPRRFGLPITFGSFEKTSMPTLLELPKEVGLAERHHGHFRDAVEHLIAFMWAEIGIERQMRRFPRDEICMIVAEDTDRIKKIAKQCHAMLHDEEQIKTLLHAERIAEIPLDKIEDTPHFASKADSAPLQVADICAFLIMRRLIRRSETQALFEAIAPQLIWYPVIDGKPVFGEPMGNEKIAGGERYGTRDQRFLAVRQPQPRGPCR
jgi:hypothetical protein